MHKGRPQKSWDFWHPPPSPRLRFTQPISTVCPQNWPILEPPSPLCADVVCTFTSSNRRTRICRTTWSGARSTTTTRTTITGRSRGEESEMGIKRMKWNKSWICGDSMYIIQTAQPCDCRRKGIWPRVIDAVQSKWYREQWGYKCLG